MIVHTTFTIHPDRKEQAKDELPGCGACSRNIAAATSGTMPR